MRKRDVVLVIALLLVIPVVLVGCGSKKSEVPAVEASIKGFADAYARGQYQTCMDYLTDTDTNAITGELSLFHQASPTIQVDSIDNVTVDGSTAKADVTVTALSKQVTIQMTLTKVDDTWKFSFGDMLTAIEKQFGF